MQAKRTVGNAHKGRDGLGGARERMHQGERLRVIALAQQVSDLGELRHDGITLDRISLTRPCGPGAVPDVVLARAKTRERPGRMAHESPWTMAAAISTAQTKLAG